jgi:hypothetical protein
MKKIILLLIFVGLFLPFRAAAEAPIKKGETLELQRCVEIALKKHPGIQAAASTLKAGEIRLLSAGERLCQLQPDGSGYNGRPVLNKRRQRL